MSCPKDGAGAACETPLSMDDLIKATFTFASRMIAALVSTSFSAASTANLTVATLC
jgi:hypothetical protein